MKSPTKTNSIINVRSNLKFLSPVSIHCFNASGFNKSGLAEDCLLLDSHVHYNRYV